MRATCYRQDGEYLVRGVKVTGEASEACTSYLTILTIITRAGREGTAIVTSRNAQIMFGRERAVIEHGILKLSRIISIQQFLAFIVRIVHRLPAFVYQRCRFVGEITDIKQLVTYTIALLRVNSITIGIS